FQVQPYFIARIEDDYGTVLYRADPAIACDDCAAADDRPAAAAVIEPLQPVEAAADETAPAVAVRPEDQPPRYAERVLPAQNAYLMQSMMRDVIRRGTGRRAMELGRGDLAGKTGTTNDQRDAWFSGFNLDLVTTVWVGFDQLKPLGARETGGRAA